MKTFKTTKLPSLLYSNQESASEDADRHNELLQANGFDERLSICKIIYLDDWNGTEKHLGYGLTDGEKLLETKDFTYI